MAGRTVGAGEALADFCASAPDELTASKSAKIKLENNIFMTPIRNFARRCLASLHKCSDDNCVGRKDLDEVVRRVADKTAFLPGGPKVRTYWAGSKVFDATKQ